MNENISYNKESGLIYLENSLIELKTISAIELRDSETFKIVVHLKTRGFIVIQTNELCYESLLNIWEEECIKRKLETERCSQKKISEETKQRKLLSEILLEHSEKQHKEILEKFDKLLSEIALSPKDNKPKFLKDSVNKESWTRKK